MEPRPRPLLGTTLGILLALVVVGLLWQLAVIDPGRLVTFLILAVSILAVTGLLTRSVAAARGRFVTVAVASGILAGVGLTGIPELVDSGAISDGCTLEVRGGDAVVTPADTTAFDPFEVAKDDVIAWSAAVEAPITVDERLAGMRVAGFAVPVNTVTVIGAAPADEFSGEVDVAQALAWIKDNTGLEVTGAYHAYGSISGVEGECVVDGYVVLAPADVFATNVLIGLWIALGVTLILIAWGALEVRKSFVDAERARGEADRVFSSTLTTGAATTGASTGYVAAHPEQAGSRPSDGEEAPADADPEPEPEPAPEPAAPEPEAEPESEPDAEAAAPEPEPAAPEPTAERGSAPDVEDDAPAPAPEHEDPGARP